MDSRRLSALKRLARGLAAAATAGAVTYALAELPSLGDVVPAPELSIPILMAALLAADKWIRAKRQPPA